jgi:organic hydroperoxide reductase OsmC/OhrA
MASGAEIRAAQERVSDVFRRKPAAVFSTAKGSASLAEGLLCHYRQDGQEAVMDMGVVMGGTGAAPTPGFYFRAAVAGCAAIGIKMTAARQGIEIEAIQVDVEMDFDDSALLGMGGNSAAPLETRLSLLLKSGADMHKLTAMVDSALAADPFFLALRDLQKVSTTITRE